MVGQDVFTLRLEGLDRASNTASWPGYFAQNARTSELHSYLIESAAQYHSQPRLQWGPKMAQSSQIYPISLFGSDSTSVIHEPYLADDKEDASKLIGS